VGSLIGNLASWAVDVIDKLGYWGLFLILVLENVFPPIPSEAVLPLAGFLTGEGRMNYFLAVIVSTSGAVVGALVLYFFGQWFGNDRIVWMIRRWGKWFAITEEDFNTAGAWFDRRGYIAVLVCRCVPIVRSLVSIPAGIRKMPLIPFVIYSAIGSTVWNSILIGLGWIVGDNWEDIEHYADYFQYFVIVLILLLGVYYVYKRKDMLMKQFLGRGRDKSTA
jgi:membrane protein DedA with SNARE-associated domain